MNRLVGRIQDNYRIDEFLGRGARGAAFRAFDLENECEVALKFFDLKYAAQPELESQFKLLQASLNRVEHPNIIRFDKIKTTKAGIPIYLAMEFSPYGNLRQRQAELGLAGAIEIIRQTCLTLDFAHKKQIFHRALKPENILLGEATTDNGIPRPLLADLGIPAWTDLGSAKMLYLEPSTDIKIMPGVLNYVAPEQIRGQPLDARSDIYALGVILYELVAGQVPFAVNTISQAIRQHGEISLPPLSRRQPDIPEILVEIIQKALAKLPDDRFQHVTKMADGLTQALEAMPSIARPMKSLLPLASQSRVIGSRPADTSSQQISGTPAKPPTGGRPSNFATQQRWKEPSGPSSPPPGNPPPPTEANEPNYSPIRVDYNVSGYLFVSPGDDISFSFVATNQTQRTSTFELSVEGIPDDWITDLPPRIKLTPNQPHEIRLTISPPRSPKSRVGQHDLLIQMFSADLPGARGTVTKPIILNRFVEFECDLTPKRGRIDAGRTGKVIIHNRGNSSESFLVRWHDGSDSLKFKPSRERVQVSAGDKSEIPFQAVPNQILTIGPMPLIQNLERHPFSVSVSLDDAQEICQGEIVTRGLVPARFGIYFVMTLLLLTLTCVLWFWLARPPSIENVVLNPLQPNCNQPFSLSWLINRDAWGVNVDVLANSSRIAAGLGRHDQYLFPEGVAQPYTLVVQARNWFGSDSKSVSVCGLNATLEVSSQQVEEGTPIIVQWTTTNAQTVLLEPFGMLPQEEFSGSKIDTPRQDTTYKLTASNGMDTPIIITRTISVFAGSPPDVEFRVEPSVVTLKRDNFITLTWQVDNADTASIQPDVGTIIPCNETEVDSCNQRVLPAPSRDTVYRLVAENSAKVVTHTAKVSVVRVDEPQVINFSASPPVVISGVNQSVILSWQTRGTSMVRIDPDVGVFPPSGQWELPAPIADTTYTLIAENEEMRSDAAAVTIKVQNPAPPVINSFTVLGESQIIIDEDDREAEVEIVLSWDVDNVTENDQVTLTRGYDGKVVANWVSGSMVDRVPAISRSIDYFLFARNNFNQTVSASVKVTIRER